MNMAQPTTSALREVHNIRKEREQNEKDNSVVITWSATPSSSEGGPMKPASLYLWSVVNFLFLLFLALPAYPHSGGLDAKGCHHDRKNGGYHCHRAQATETELPDKSQSSLSERKSSSPEAPVTYIGPRGGRYHYSASGRKVYERRR
jgi:hypothetical protein